MLGALRHEDGAVVEVLGVLGIEDPDEDRVVGFLEVWREIDGQVQADQLPELLRAAHRHAGELTHRASGVATEQVRGAHGVGLAGVAIQDDRGHAVGVLLEVDQLVVEPDGRLGVVFGVLLEDRLAAQQGQVG